MMHVIPPELITIPSRFCGISFPRQPAGIRLIRRAAVGIGVGLVGLGQQRIHRQELCRRRIVVAGA